MTSIKQLKKNGQDFYPKIASESIILPDGQTLEDRLAEKQNTLISGDNIKTVNNQSLLGSGNITVNSGEATILELQNLVDGEYTPIQFSREFGCTDGNFLQAVSKGYGYVKIGTTDLFTTAAPIYPIIVKKSKNSDISTGWFNGISIIEEDKIIEIVRSYIRDTVKYTISTINKDLSTKQDTLVSGTNIKTINNTSLLGEGNITIESGGSDVWESGTGTNSIQSKNAGCIATGNNSIAEGYKSETGGSYTENTIDAGTPDVTAGSYAHVEGRATIAVGGMGAHAEGNKTLALGRNSHAEGNNTVAKGITSHAEGASNIAVGNYSHVENGESAANGNYSHAEGRRTCAKGAYSHTENGGYNLNLTLSGSDLDYSFVIDNDEWNHFREVFGINTFRNLLISNYIYKNDMVPVKITDVSQESEYGDFWTIYTEKPLSDSPLDGQSGFYVPLTVAQGNSSHAEGSGLAFGNNSHAEGLMTVTLNEAEHACGKYNVSTLNETQFSVGIGEPDNRKNAIEIRKNGDMYVNGLGNYQGVTTNQSKTLQQYLSDREFKVINTDDKCNLLSIQDQLIVSNAVESNTWPYLIFNRIISNTSLNREKHLFKLLECDVERWFISLTYSKLINGDFAKYICPRYSCMEVINKYNQSVVDMTGNNISAENGVVIDNNYLYFKTTNGEKIYILDDEMYAYTASYSSDDDGTYTIGIIEKSDLLIDDPDIKAVCLSSSEISKLSGYPLTETI